MQMVEKSEFRSHGAQAVGVLTSQMQSKDYACFVKWLSNFSRSSKVTWLHLKMRDVRFPQKQSQMSDSLATACNICNKPHPLMASSDYKGHTLYLKCNALHHPASVDGSPALLCRRGDGFVGAARAATGGMWGCRACPLSAAQVLDPEPAVCSADGQLPHSPRPHPFLSGSVSGAPVIQRHPGRPQSLLCQWAKFMMFRCEEFVIILAF